MALALSASGGECHGTRSGLQVRGQCDERRSAVRVRGRRLLLLLALLQGTVRPRAGPVPGRRRPRRDAREASVRARGVALQRGSKRTAPKRTSVRVWVSLEWLSRPIHLIVRGSAAKIRR